MSAASRYLERMRTIWPRWDQEPFRDYADDGSGGEPGLESRFGAWRDAFLAKQIPNEFERSLVGRVSGKRDHGTFRLGPSRMRILLYLFCPFVYGRDWGSMSADRHRGVALPGISPAAEQEARVATFLAHLDNFQSHFYTIRGNATAPPFHDAALVVAIALHEGGVTTAFTSDEHGRVADPSQLSARHPPARYPPDDWRPWQATMTYIHRQRNLHSFYDNGLDHLGGDIDEFRRWGWIPPQYDDDGGRRTWLYESMPTGPVPSTLFTPERREVLARCYPGNFYQNYDYVEKKCFDAAVVPQGDILACLCLIVWHQSRLLEREFQDATLFPGESVADLPAGFRRLLTLFAFGSSSFQRPAQVRRERQLASLVARMNRRGRVPDTRASHVTVGAALQFLKESAAGRTAAATASDPDFHDELYAQFALGHRFPRNRFWRAFVAALLDEADVLRAPPAP